MGRRLPPLNGLRAFEAAARRGGFARAAAELGVTPAAVSHQVKGLEEGLGVTLFERHARGLELTPAGAAYAAELTGAFNHLARAQAALRKRELSGTLTVSTLPSLATLWLVPRLADFRTRYPEIDLRLLSETHLTDWETCNVDVAIRYGRGHYPDLKVRRLFGETVSPVCGPSLLSGDPPLRAWTDLTRHTLLHDWEALEEEPSITWGPWLRDHGLDESAMMHGLFFNDSTAIIQAARHGVGVAVGRSRLVAQHLIDGRLVRPFEVSRPAEFAYYLVAPEDRAGDPKVAVLAEWLLEQGQEPEPWEAAPGPWSGGGDS